MRRFAQLVLDIDKAHPDIGGRIRGWYAYPGEWAGFIVLDAGTHEELRDILSPFTALMSIEVRPLVEMNWEQSRVRLAALLRDGARSRP